MSAVYKESMEKVIAKVAWQKGLCITVQWHMQEEGQLLLDVASSTPDMYKAYCHHRGKLRISRLYSKQPP